MFKKILVPLDGSTLAETILPQVTELAKVLGAELAVLRIAYVHSFPGIDLMQEETRTVHAAEEYVASIGEKLANEGVKVKTSVRYGEPAAEILSHIVDNGLELVAMCTHGRSGLSRLVMGSVAEQVVRKAGIPVLLLRASDQHSAQP